LKVVIARGDTGGSGDNHLYRLGISAVYGGIRRAEGDAVGGGGAVLLLQGEVYLAGKAVLGGDGQGGGGAFALGDGESIRVEGEGEVVS